jgi:hypothetical protein
MTIRKDFVMVKGEDKVLEYTFEGVTLPFNFTLQWKLYLAQTDAEDAQLITKTPSIPDPQQPKAQVTLVRDDTVDRLGRSYWCSLWRIDNNAFTEEANGELYLREA